MGFQSLENLDYCTASVTVLLTFPPTVRDSGTSVVLGMPAGIVTLTWFKPTQHPDCPAKSGTTVIPAMVTVTGATALDSVTGSVPVGTDGLNWPKPVA